MLYEGLCPGDKCPRTMKNMLKILISWMSLQATVIYVEPFSIYFHIRFKLLCYDRSVRPGDSHGLDKINFVNKISKSGYKFSY